jgi:hypothetical protein
MIKFELIGGNEVIQKLQTIEPKIYDSLLKTITILSIQLQSNIKSQKLSGQVLKTKTGTLRRSINQATRQDESSISGIVGIGEDAKKYGVMHEFGFSGTENIKAHLRTIKQAFGKSIAPKTINIRGHSRVVNYPEHSFMRSALTDMNDEIIQKINKAIQI